MGKLMYGSLDRRFFHRLGASLLDRTICATAGAAGCDITLGTRAIDRPRGGGALPLHHQLGLEHRVTNIHFWAIDARGPQARGEDRHHRPVPEHDGRRSPTGGFPIRPGTDAALALGVMHVIFRDGLQDHDYLDRYCLGADQLRERVLDGVPAAKVSRDHRPFRRRHRAAGPRVRPERRNCSAARRSSASTTACSGTAAAAWRCARSSACPPSPAPGGTPAAGRCSSTSKLYPFDDERTSNGPT